MEQEVILREDICYHLWNLCHFGHKTLEKKGKIGTNGTLGDGNCHFPSSIAPCDSPNWLRHFLLHAAQ